MLYQVMKYLRNYFHVRGAGKSGTFSVVGGELNLPFMKNGQYFHIEGSIFNDGVYKYPASGLSDEVFVGFVSPMAVPQDFIRLCEEISDWNDKYGESSRSPYTSESFGGYSYSKATSSSGEVVGWKDQFKADLKKWRKL